MSDAAPIRTLRQNLVFENEFLRVHNDDVQFPSGETGTYVRTRWTAPHGVAALPIWDGKLLLMRNYRYSEQAQSIEIPQGFGVEGATPHEDIQRELFEEIGAQANRLTPMGHTGNDYRTHMFLAHMPDDFRFDASGKEAGEAFGDPLICPIPDSPSALIHEHGIFDALTQILLLRLEIYLRENGPRKI